jgi:hypothetical protein
MNKEIRLLEDNLIALLNDSSLPIEVKRLVVKDVLSLVSKQADREILDEIKQEQQEEQKDSE